MAKCSGGGGGGGGTPNNFMFWLFPENGSISERTVNREGINSSYSSIKFCINKTKYINFHFRHVPKLSIGVKQNNAVSSQASSCHLVPGGGGGGTHVCWWYGDVPL